MSAPATYCPWRNVGLPAPQAPVSFAGGRRTSGVLLSNLFPERTDGVCACGCGRPVVGRRRRWASDACSRGAWLTCLVVAGDTDGLRRVCEVKGRARKTPFIGPLPVARRPSGSLDPYSGRKLSGWVWDEGERIERERLLPLALASPDTRRPVTLTRCAACLVWHRAEEWQADHVVAVALGGTHHPDNLQPLCLTCHVTKSTHDGALIRAAKIRTAAPRPV